MVGPRGRRLLELALRFGVLRKQPLGLVTELRLALLERFPRVTQRLVRLAEARAKLHRAFIGRWRRLEAARRRPVARSIALAPAAAGLKFVARLLLPSTVGVRRSVRAARRTRRLSAAVARWASSARPPVDPPAWALGARRRSPGPGPGRTLSRLR